MDTNTFTKGIYTAKAHTHRADNGEFQGYVILARDDGDETENMRYDVHTTSSSEEEAFEEAKALAHRILGEIEL
ncbi:MULTISPECIES: hypothetical protein [Burkholderia]|jgi:hypothetical protein|uniref:Uncharacterized protein n=7 Tax=Burkholderia cepacia complex TaxID=87882 RepID=A0A1V6KLA7_9BURK|nr:MULTISPECIES: hypothetical protein [Burkholderia]AIO47266.1 hypothetical protein DM42_2034 [Burkholderia cepacia]ESS36777.1 hypothetical protein P355_1761 [Burkholderia cenocepacia KC-01]BEV53078.1 hypothetical protein BconGalA64_55780 [Burkholderia contaminans]ABK09723.1 conserved hypothetical protein [Burkholderia cenocepacia HI2424]ACA92153.1 conserved hypothetical protein [Burkholderia orbicola MC0-3]